jgi:IS30 family transposase
MTKKYNQLTLRQRYKIEAYIEAGNSQTQIALLLGVHKSTISRELKRNIPKRGVGAKIYNAIKAHSKTEVRHSAKAKYTSFTLELKQQMSEWMNKRRYSPELVSAQWKKNNIQGVSHECMYRFIWQCKHSNKRINKAFKELHKFLKHGKRRRKRGNYKDTRGLIPGRVSIEYRPAIVQKRERFGDVEVDLIMGKNHKSALLVIVDRATLLTTIDKLAGKNADTITHRIIARMAKLPPLKTMTFDNDQAFTQHQIIAKVLNVDTFFTRPYTSQDKGTIENRNGVIRQFFPKKTDFNSIDPIEVQRVECQMNNRPIRKFGYLTPNEVFLQMKVSVALIS